jgi:hypothetical protein
LTAEPTCHQFESSVAQGTMGAATPGEAVSAWLTTKPQYFDPVLAHWQPSTNGDGRYVAGPQSVELFRIEAPGSGYVVISGTTCARIAIGSETMTSLPGASLSSSATAP